MMRALLVRGMGVGLLAGLLMFGFGTVFGEPQVDRAIGFEHAMDEARAAAAGTHAHEEAELVSRPTQAGLGLLTGVAVYAAAFGGLFALVFGVAYRRVGDLGARAVAVLLALGGFIAVYVVPNLKYPANPPAIGEAETIGLRTALYVTMLGLSVAALVAGAILRRRLVARHGSWNAALLSAAFYLVAVATAAALLPGIDEVPPAFPATLLWQFRVVAFGMQAVLWTTLGLGFGLLAERILEPADRRAVLPRGLSHQL